MPDNKRRFIPIILSIVFLIILVIVGLKIKDQLAPADSSALFGGRLESFYPTAGFLVIFQDDGIVDFCGVSFTTNTSGVTAAHCFDKSGERFVGKGEFTLDRSKLTPISSFVQKTGWDHTHSDNDLSTFSLASSIGLDDSILVADVVDGCNYRVVAYGRTETETTTLSATRPRKSAQVCATVVDNNIIKLTGDGGICLGDSGSPVYIEGTNQVIGVISAITRTDNSKPICYVGNTANVVRLDTNKSFLNNSFFVKPVSSSSSRSSSSVSSAVGQISTIGSLDISNVLTDQNVLIASLVGVVVFGGLVIYKIYTGRPKPPVY